MNKILRYILALFVLSVTCGCEDFLTRYPIDQIGEGDFYKNTDEVSQGILACYNGLLEPTDIEWMLTEIRSDNTRHSNGNSGTTNSKDLYTLDVLRVPTTHNRVKEYWETSYRNIKNCNKILKSLPAVDSETSRQQFEGEALFIRSWHYFNLVRLFGPLFLVTEVISVDESLAYERSSIDDVYEQIITDLESVTTNSLLPTGYNDAALGRADIWAAKTLLAKVYMTRERFNDALPLLRDVYNNSGYGDPTLSYADIFSLNNKMNKELIFSVRYTPGSYGMGSPFASYFAPSGDAAHIIIGSGDGFNAPSEDLLSSYELRNDGSGKYDYRRAACFENNWEQTGGEVVHVPWTRKYFSTVSKKYDGSNDWPAIRFADVVLMLGETENEINGPSAGLPYINEIRSRAGLRNLTSTDVPTKTMFRLAMEQERRIEFAGENHRFFDLLRTGRAIGVLTSHFQKETIRDAKTGDPELLYMNSNTARFPDVSMFDNPNIEEWQLTLPIPFTVMSVAANASQNPGY